MTCRKSSLIRTVVIVISLFAILFCAALFQYPYSVRNALSEIIPSVRVGYFGTSINYSKKFNDNQSRHIKAAKAVGLKNMPQNRDDVYEMSDFLEKVRNCKAYSLAKMEYSAPYLRPNAKAALDIIGMAFRDSLKSKGLPDYKILVTSVLRTKADVDKLQNSNSVAVSNSCHCYGTTFDISYKQFEPLSLFRSMSQEDLKKVLGEVLSDQMRDGNIYVKHEISQSCFHITSRR